MPEKYLLHINSLFIRSALWAGPKSFNLFISLIEIPNRNTHNFERQLLWSVGHVRVQTPTCTPSSLFVRAKLQWMTSVKWQIKKKKTHIHRMTRAKFVVSSLQFSSSDITFINFMKLLLLCMTVILLLLNWKMGYFSSLSSRLICFFLSSSSLLFFSCVCSCCYWKSSSLCERRIYGQAKASIAIANINLFETQHIIAMSRDWAVCAQERQIFSRRVMSSCFCRNEQTQNNMKKKKRILSGILVLASGDSRSEICFYLLAVDIRVHKESSRPSYVGCVCVGARATPAKQQHRMAPGG